MQDFDYSTISAGYYDDIYSTNRGVRSYWHRRLFSRIEALITPKQSMNILDVGCAAGSLLASLKLSYNDAVGIDISEAQVLYANKKYGGGRLRFVTSDIRTYSFGAEKFDCIIMNQVIEHISYAESVEILNKLKSLLRPGGQLIMTTPNYASVWPAVEFLLNRVTPVSYEHQHINKFDPKRMRQILKETGLKLQDLSFFHFMSFYLAGFSYPLADRLGEWESRFLSPLGMMMIASCTAEN